MKKKRSIKKSLVTVGAIIILGVLGYSNNWFGLLDKNVTYAAGDLMITWDNVPSGDPIFVVENMLPGDTEERDIIVENQGVVTHEVRIRGVKTAEEKDFASVLDFVITRDGIPIYGTDSSTGAKTLQDFFDDSGTADGLYLDTLDAGESSTFNLKATFPSSSGNEYQLARVVFNLIIGVKDDTPEPTVTPSPSPSPTPTPTKSPCGTCCDDINVDISGNGAGSVNGVYIECKNFKVIKQINETVVNNNINITSNTGNNSINNNVFSNFTKKLNFKKPKLFNNFRF